MDAEFKRLNDAQFSRATSALQSVARNYIYYIAADLTERTPGFGNQQPEDTLYIPTGRLRGGLNWTLVPILQSSKGLHAKRDEDGPFSDYGRETLERIAAQLESQRLGGISYLENDVGYGDIIRMGKGRHRAAGPRDWPLATERSQASLLRKAMQNLDLTP